jgi:DNA-binding NarL/FixJ family response regulator
LTAVLDGLATRARLELAATPSASRLAAGEPAGIGSPAQIGAPAPIGSPAQIGAPSESGASSAGDLFGLTRREREVLTLLVRGRTNRQIAQALFISESTAGVHVSNILGKLGAASRTEAAGIAVRLGIGAG